MASETEIANMAIGHLGISKEIGNLNTEKSAEAQACRRFYPTVRDFVLRDFAWPFATRSVVSLGLVTDMTGIDGAEFDYSYRYPADCIMFRKILSGIRTDAPETRVPYRILSDAVGGLIYTDQQNALAEYTAQITDPQRFPPDFTFAASLLLAYASAPRLTFGDPFKLGERAATSYDRFISAAWANSANEEQPDRQREAEFVRIRGGSDALQKTFLGQKVQNFPAQDL